MSRRQRSPRKLRSGRVRLRHVKRDQALGDGPPATVLGVVFYPSWAGINGNTSQGRGWMAGTVRPEPLNDVGTATVQLPNTAGSDGRLHRDRFAILRNGRATPSPAGTVYRGGSYRPGDEWLEVYPEGRTQTPGFVGTPIAAVITPTTIELTIADGVWLNKKAREFASGFWNHAPRDVIEHYSSLVRAEALTSFDDPTIFGAGLAFDNVERTVGAWSMLNMRDTRAGTGEVVPGSLWLGPSAAGQTAYLCPSSTLPQGRLSTDPHAAHRVECRVSSFAGSLPGAGDAIALMLRDGATPLASTPLAYVIVFKDGTTRIYTATVVAERDAAIAKADVVNANTLDLAIETRNRWAFFYLNGRLLGVLPYNGGNTIRPMLRVTADATVGFRTPRVEQILWRRTRPYAAGRSANRGDARLPGAPTPGGLIADYFNDADLIQLTQAERRDRRLAPTRASYFSRVEPGADATVTSTPHAPPPGPPSDQYWSVRMMGAIYLDLVAHDYTYSWNGIGRARVWIGDTRVGTELLRRGQVEADVGASVGMRSLFGQLNGWYPILIENAFDTDALDGAGGGGFRLMEAIDGGAYAKVPTARLSPIGIYKDVVRYDSHFDVLSRVASTFGYQWRAEPRQLESGQFPVELLPKVRVGRDTTVVLEEAVGVQSTISAEDVADALLSDAQGLADPAGQTQLTAEALNFAELPNHLAVMSEFEQSSDVTVPELLLQRLSSLLELRGGPWEEVAANPDGEQVLADTFPLTGALATFAWRPGDGIRIDQDRVGVTDLVPRGIVATEWPMGPGGLKTPQATFRSRRRDAVQMVRELVGDVRDAQRNYQGQTVQVDGSIGSNIAAIAGEVTSRLAWAPGAKLLEAWVCVQHKSDASAWGLQINGVTHDTITTVGTFDVTTYLESSPGATNAFASATVVPGTGNVIFTLHALVGV